MTLSARLVIDRPRNLTIGILGSYLPLPYAGKVFDFARSAGAPTLTGVARDQGGLLLAEVDRLWDEYPGRRSDVRSWVEKLRSQARATGERCRAVLEWVESGSAAQYSTTV